MESLKRRGLGCYAQGGGGQQDAFPRCCLGPSCWVEICMLKQAGEKDGHWSVEYGCVVHSSMRTVEQERDMI